MVLDKLKWPELAPKGEAANLNREIIRAKAIIAELRLNNQKAHELTHRLKNLLTVQRLIREQIHLASRRTSLQGQASIPKITTWRTTKELRNLTIEREKMKESEVKSHLCATIYR